MNKSNPFSSLKKYISFSWIKDNLSFLILFPTVCGGIWQLFELIAIGPAYIRFFSISQLVSDGILVGYVLMWMYIMAIVLLYDRQIMSFIIRDSKKAIHNDEVQNEVIVETISRSAAIFRFFIVLAAVIGFLYFSLIPLITKIKKQDLASIADLMWLTWLCVALVVMLRGLYWLLIGIFNLESFMKKNDVRNTFRVLILFAVLGSPFLLYPLLRLFHKSFLFPQNFKNKDYISCKIQRNNPGSKNWGIEYFNDKYIFVKLQNGKGETKIEVLSFETFLDSDACNKEQEIKNK